MEAVQKWRTEKEFHPCGDKQQEKEEEEEKSIYSVHNEEVTVASCFMLTGKCAALTAWRSVVLLLPIL